MQNNTFSTLFIGQNLIKLTSVDSTNNYLKNLLSKSEPLPEGTVIMADEQFAGRGQQQNTWHADPGQNLTISILLKPSFLPLEKQFLLNMAISIAINNALKVFISQAVKIKWPNDIYYQNKKIGGVLIENTIVGSTIKNTIVGIGLNVNQQAFLGELSTKATSLTQILQQDVNLHQLMLQICSHIESLYLKLRAGNYTFLAETYVDKLYQINETALYRQNGEVFEGTIKGVTESGVLRLERDGILQEYNFKEIEFLNQIQ